MKKLLLIFSLVPIVSLGQVKTSVTNGDFWNPTTWDCFCLPADGDSLVINHSVNLNLDIGYNTGQILISATGQLSDGGVDRSVWVNGGSIVNYGVYSSHNLWLGNGGYIHNYGFMVGVDSLLNQATFINQYGASLEVYDLANDQMATFNNIGTIDCTNNMHNQGLFTNDYVIDVANDYSNCNTQSMDAMFINDGVFCITNDFLNCDGDTMTGTGDYFVGNQSSNLGVFDGTHTFHTPTGSLTLNTGTIAPSVTITTGTCTSGIIQNEVDQLNVYPNPTSGLVTLSTNNVIVEVLNVSGQRVKEAYISNHTLDLSDLKNGMYFLKIDEKDPIRLIKN